MRIDVAPQERQAPRNLRPFMLPGILMSLREDGAAPHMGSSSTWCGFKSASRTMAAAMVGRSDAGKCSTLQAAAASCDRTAAGRRRAVDGQPELGCVFLDEPPARRNLARQTLGEPRSWRRCAGSRGRRSSARRDETSASFGLGDGVVNLQRAGQSASLSVQRRMLPDRCDS